VNPSSHTVSGRGMSKPRCPKCNGPFVNVSGWHWCHRCGHREEGQACQTVTTSATSTTKRPKTASGPSELELAVRVIPAWGWYLLLGLGCVVAVSFIADYNLPEKSRIRALWSTFQVLSGLAVFLIAGVAASGQLRCSHQSLGVSDILFPDRLWVMAIKNLPATRWHVCTAVWAFAAVVCGIFCVGGLSYWLPSKIKPKPAKVPFASEIIKAARTKDESPEDESKTDDQDSATAKPAKPEPPKAEPPQETPSTKKTLSRCIIVGYTTRGEELDGLLVATVEVNELNYAGIVPAPADPAVRDNLMNRFASLKAKTPVFPDLDAKAVWLQPRLSCEVEGSGMDEDQLLKSPVFKGLALPKTAESDRKSDKEDKNAPDAAKPAGPKSTTDKN
jgi:hypothetical protein